MPFAQAPVSDAIMGEPPLPAQPLFLVFVLTKSIVLTSWISGKLFSVGLKLDKFLSENQAEVCF